ncbi:MAG: undecaprenyl/decaprenyl-phosphate alpha-N-acetylglucosaminyl 1-phosphate transferase, partial [candidate division Zixibacteria bacterium]|nr:undecaprenyl/decaprenyl-phosphate alpha-N-acetylglucosaminyl 1-phosphate transferase [candidate division Zixibacteria bacterium]
IPFTGGWAVFIGFWLGVLLAYLLVPEFAAGLGQYLPGVFAAHLLIFLGGVVDDFVDLAAWLKLAIQATAAMILIASGLKIDTIYIPFTGSFLLGDLTYPATILWVLVIVNAVNIVDGLDGLAAGLSVITSIGLLYVGLTLQVPVVVGLAVILLGVLPAFLRFNYANASIFLGDSGAQSIGFVFAVAAIYFPIKSYTVVAMFVPLLSLGVPLVELALSFVRRLLVGKPVMAGDYGHLFHVLVKRGLSHRATVLVFYAVAVSLQIFVFTLFLFDRRVVFSILVLFMMVTAAWFLRLSRQEER